MTKHTLDKLFELSKDEAEQAYNWHGTFDIQQLSLYTHIWSNANPVGFGDCFHPGCPWCGIINGDIENVYFDYVENLPDGEAQAFFDAPGLGHLFTPASLSFIDFENHWKPMRARLRRLVNEAKKIAYPGMMKSNDRDVPVTERLKNPFLPPLKMQVRDNHGGLTAVTKWANMEGPSVAAIKRQATEWSMVEDTLRLHLFDTLWRPIGVTRSAYPQGDLFTYLPGTFYQNNNNAVLGLYIVPSYQYLVGCWFDQDSGERLA